MTYKYAFKVDVWDEEKCCETTEQGIIVEDNAIAAMQALSEYYGDDNFTKIELVCMDNDPILFSDPETYEAFINGNAPFKLY